MERRHNPDGLMSSSDGEKFRRSDVRHMLNTCLKNADDKTKPFIRSLSGFFTRRTFLTEKQIDALIKIYRRLS